MMLHLLYLLRRTLYVNVQNKMTLSHQFALPGLAPLQWLLKHPAAADASANSPTLLYKQNELFVNQAN